MFQRKDLTTTAGRHLDQKLRDEGFTLDPHHTSTLERLEHDVQRIACDMDDPERQPPMIWTGIPFPSPENTAVHTNGHYSLVISVGGTKTGHALMRLVDGEPRLLDPPHGEVCGSRIATLKKGLVFPTPTPDSVSDGFAMIDRIVEVIAERLESVPAVVQRCEAVLLSWGFAHHVFRSSETVLGGVTARNGRMQKDQTPFTRELEGQDIGELFRKSIRKHLEVELPLTIANDGVAALHYFLSAENLVEYRQIGLFINGTGANFALAEPYVVRPQGVVSQNGEQYEPIRLRAAPTRRAGDSIELYFVNYECGTIALNETRTRYDVDSLCPLEENALSGGNAFEQQFREVVSDVSPDLYARVLANHVEHRDTGAPAGPEVSRLAAGGPAAMEEVFPGANLDRSEAELACLAALATVERSALHAALVLAAAGLRTGFGSGTVPDLLALEGSVWRAPGYQKLVRNYWEQLAKPAILNVEFDHEPSYDASLIGPLHLAARHR